MSKKNPVYDPDAKIYLLGIGSERDSYSNPGGKFRELEVCIDNINSPQSGHSYVDTKMENYKTKGWPTMTTILLEGHVLTGRGVLRKNYKTDEVYYDADHINDLELVDDIKPKDNNEPKSTNNNFSDLFPPKS